MDFFKRHFFVALSAVLGLIIIAYVGARGNLQLVFGVVVPYLAVLIFVEGLIYRVIQWARSPVPFRIPTTGGQGRTLPWIKRDLGEKLDNPSDFPASDRPHGPGSPGLPQPVPELADGAGEGPGQPRRRPADSLVLQVAVAGGHRLPLRLSGGHPAPSAVFHRAGAVSHQPALRGGRLLPVLHARRST